MTDPTTTQQPASLDVGKVAGSSRRVRLPLELATEAQAILGQRGRGKTNTAVVIAEELIRAGVPLVVVDTVGVWWGLRSSATGKRAGLDVVVFGGEHADVPLEETAGKVVARVILEQRISWVIDTSGLPSKAAARRFLLDFVTALYLGAAKDRQPLHVIFDEADELAPQRPGPDGARLLGAMEDFVRRGRSRGLGCTLVTQRAAVLNKDVLTQVEVLWALGMTGPTDVKAIDAWTSANATPEQAAEVKQTLAGLPRGTAWLWSPQFLDLFERVEIRQRTTFDSSATPKIGEQRVEPTARATIDLEQLGAEIAATVERAHADDPRQLRRRIAALEKQLADRPTPPPRILEVPVLDDAERDLLRRVDAHLTDLTAITRDLQPIWHKLDALTAPPPQPEPSHPADPPAAPEPTLTRSTRPSLTAGSTTLSKAQRAVLTALATYGTRTLQQTATLTGYSAKGGGFTNAISALRTAGYLEGGRDALTITPAGTTVLGPYTPLPAAGRPLREHWIARSSKAERAILTALADNRIGVTDRDHLANLTGYEPTGGGFNNAISKLRTLGLIHGPRHAIALADELGDR